MNPPAGPGGAVDAGLGVGQLLADCALECQRTGATGVRPRAREVSKMRVKTENVRGISELRAPGAVAGTTRACCGDQSGGSGGEVDMGASRLSRPCSCQLSSMATQGQIKFEAGVAQGSGAGAPRRVFTAWLGSDLALSRQ
jgi:hypothetical protein